MMKQLIKIIFVSFLSLLHFTAWSQNFPVRVTPVLTPPYTPFITDYTETGSDKLTLQVLLTDLTVSSYHCKLRLTIEGVNISITTNPNYTPPPLILQGGTSELLYGSDLADYFNFDNLVFNGISKNEIQQKGNKLPEGVYRFTFEVLDYNRNVVVSNKGTTTAWMLLNEPPFINLPINDTKLKPLDPQNIVFQWTPRHTASPNSAFTTEYEVKLYEIWPKGRNAFDAVNTSQPIYTATTASTMAVYGPAETSLVLGREYALQVKAKDTGGKDLFRNNGLSEVIKFTYGDECPVPIDLQSDRISNNNARIRWQSNALNTGYILRYREKREGAAWFEQNTTQSYFSPGGLQPATTYEYQLAGQCLSYFSNYSEQKTLTTLITNPNAFVCGDSRTLPIPDGSPPLPVLMTNDSIKAGGFSIIVGKASSAGGKFTGEGIAIIPWFNYAKIRVTFENITVNKSYQLSSGIIKSVWDKDSKLLRTIEQVNSEDTVSTSFKSDVATFEADSLMMINGMIISVSANSAGNTVVNTNDGTSIVLEKGKSYAIADQVGNGYLVDKEGNIKKTTATDAIIAGTKGEREYSDDPNRSVSFTKSAQTKYGLDKQRDGTIAQNYQQTENGKYIAWKALATGEPDFIQVIGEGNTDLSKIKFQLEGQSSQRLTANGQTLTLIGNVTGTNEEILAVDNSSDTTKNGQILGKINLISYDEQVKNLVMVVVNNTAVSLTSDEVKKSLNEIYAQAVVSWNVNKTIEQLTVPDLNVTTLDDGGSGLLSNYTADMKRVLNAYFNGNSPEDDTYYLFFVTNSQSENKLGYMPRSKQAGFIFTGAHLNNDQVLHTIAHELGHGAFHLKHTFSEFPSINEGSSDNLMDYSSGTALDKYQWDHIHNPEGVLGLFEDDEEGEMLSCQSVPPTTLGKEGELSVVRGYYTRGGYCDQKWLYYQGRAENLFEDKGWYLEGEYLNKIRDVIEAICWLQRDEFYNEGLQEFVLNQGIGSDQAKNDFLNGFIRSHDLDDLFLKNIRQEILVYGGSYLESKFGTGRIEIVNIELEIILFFESLGSSNAIKQIIQRSASRLLNKATRVVFNIGDKISEIAIKQIKNGSNGRFAIIGRSMGNKTTTGVKNVYGDMIGKGMDVEIFDASSLKGDWLSRFNDAADEFTLATNGWTKRLTNQELMKLKMYNLNKEWARKLVDEGYTILDMGDFNNQGFSVFYSMEKSIIFAQ